MTSSGLVLLNIRVHVSVTRCSSLAAVALSDRVVRPASATLCAYYRPYCFLDAAVSTIPRWVPRCAPQRIPGSIALPGPDPCRPATSVTLAGP